MSERDRHGEFDTFDQHAVIKVCGIGGGGCNSVDRMIEAGLSGVQFIAINTDAQSLKKSRAEVRVQIGTKTSGGLGAGANPEAGRAACEEDREEVRAVLQGADMVFLALGLGGGTGTGAAPIVAEEAMASGALVCAIVTLPFSFEAALRMENALKGLEQLEKHVDTLIVVPNDRIAELSRPDTFLLDAFRHGDEVLHNGVRAITELITVVGLINVDFKDLRTIMLAKGRALMGIGMAEGDDRAIRAAREAIVCPLLEQSDINGAKGVIINVRGGKDLRMQEVTEAIQFIKENAPDANIIFGVVVEKEELPEVQITVIAAGFPHKDVSSYVNRPPRAAAVPFATTPAPAPAVSPRQPPAGEKGESAPAAPAQAPAADAKQAPSPPGTAPAPERQPDRPATPPAKPAPPAQKSPGTPSKTGEQLTIDNTEPGGFRTVFQDSGPKDRSNDSRIPAFLRKRFNGNK